MVRGDGQCSHMGTGWVGLGTGREQSRGQTVQLVGGGGAHSVSRKI